MLLGAMGGGTYIQNPAYIWLAACACILRAAACCRSAKLRRARPGHSRTGDSSMHAEVAVGGAHFPEACRKWRQRRADLIAPCGSAGAATTKSRGDTKIIRVARRRRRNPSCRL